MTEQKNNKKNSLKNWIIKKILSSEFTKEEILNYLTPDLVGKNDIQESHDNNEKNLIENIFKLSEKSVDDVMVSRGEIISVEKISCASV